MAAFVVALTLVASVLYLPRHHFYFRGAAFAEFFERLPATVELIVAAFVIAVIFAAICVLCSSKRTAWIGSLVAFGLVTLACVPLFWFALVMQLVFAVQGVHIGGWFVQLPTAGMASSESSSLAEESSHLLLPAMVLALFQVTAYIHAMRDDFSGRRLFAAFAALLPAIMSADAVVEIIFAWPGVGRMVYNSIGQGLVTPLLAFLLSSAAIVLVVRAAGTAVTGNSSLPDATERL